MAVNVNAGALEFDAIINASQFGATIRKMELDLQGFAGAANKEASSIENLSRKAAGALGVFAAAFSISKFVTDVVSVRAEFQKLEAVLTNALGSGSEAQESLQMISDYVARTPFELQEVSAAYVKLVNQGIKPTKEQLTQIGDLAASTGKRFDQLTEAIIDAQTGEFERLKEFGIRASKEGDKVSFTFKGVTQQVEFSNKAIQDYIIGLGNLQGVTGATAAISATLGGQISNLRDAWTRMLNDVGTSSEGVFSAIFSAATSVVNNYQKVLDILKVLIITYGSYRAAVIATNAVTAISTSLAKGYTIAETLRYQAMLISERVMKLLNRTMLANPAVAITTAIAALAAVLVIFGKRTTEAQRVQESFNKVMDEAKAAAAAEKDELQSLLVIVKDQTKSRAEQETALQKIIALSPEYLNGLTLENIKTQEGTAFINAYIKSLDRKAEAQAISNKKTEIFTKKLELQEKQETLRAGLDGRTTGVFRSKTTFIIQSELAKAIAEIEEQDKLLGKLNEKQKSITEAEIAATTKKTEAKQRTVDVIDKEIAAQKKLQAENSTNNAEFVKHAARINELEAERRKIVGEGKKEIRAAQVQEDKTNDILNERRDILQGIADLQRDAKQTGLVKEQSELDKINEKYDQAFLKISKFNEKVNEFNKKNKTNVKQVGQQDIQELNTARQTELTNAKLKQDAEKFKQNLEVQKNLFAQFEETKKQIGLTKSNELFAGQLKGYSSYLQFLESEAERIAPKIVFGIANIGDIEKMKAITKSMNDFQRQNEEDLFKERVANIQRLFQETATINQRRKILDNQYLKDLSTLRTEFTGDELEAQERNLKNRYDSEIIALDNSLITQSQLYKQLNEDIIGFSRERIKKEIETLKAQLKAGTFIDASGQQQVISPAFKQQIEGYLESLKEFFGETNELFGISIEEIQKFVEKLTEISGIFGDIGSGLEGLNDDLADTFNTLSAITGVAASAGTAIGQFASGNILGGISSVVKAISGIFSISKKVRESERKAKEEIEEFNMRILAGEIDITQQYRERQREQVKLNQLRIKGLEDEKKLLQLQKQATLDQYNAILSQLQKQTAVIGETTKKTGGFLGIGRKTKIVEITQALAGQTFEQLEALFVKGQLTGKAKELFELLQNIKKEGADIDALLEENKRQAQEIFTGTTSTSIVDAIADGFSNGLRTAADFAGTFEDLMRGAIINALKFKYLEGPLQEFFESFAEATETDSTLTQGEIDQLKLMFNTIISNADTQFQQLQQIAGLNLSASGGAGGNSLQGAIKGMSEQTAELLAGQFGGLRITAVEQLIIARQGLIIYQNIESNTGLTATRLLSLLQKFDSYETGVKKLSVQ